MTFIFNRKIQSITLLGSVLLISACATIQSGETVANRTDQASRVVLEKGKFETPPELPASAVKVAEPVNSAPAKVPDTAQPAQPAATHINQKEPLVNVRTSPSTKSRVAGVLKKGQSVEVLETKDNWVKISWQKGSAVKQGWLKRMFVEGYEQER